ncbi:MAG: UPF0489 family protein [Eubacterium sp.]|nr:UPF0489 family protein [Eubacterium sp.]
MIDALLAKEHLRTVGLGGNCLSIVDNHQYVLLLWARAAQELGEPLTLVSVDYHPDTNPPFWLQAYQKAMAIDPLREEVLVEKFERRVLDEIDPQNLDTLAAKMSLMRNDEHINTGMTLGYLRDYHMINCMEKHLYATGTHYLVPEAHFGSLKNSAFEAAGFWVQAFLEGLEGPLVLDVDLDYFMRPTDFNYDPAAMTAFGALCRRASHITSARSQSYFEHLRRESFSMADCEEKFIALMRQILEED